MRAAYFCLDLGTNSTESAERICFQVAAFATLGICHRVKSNAGNWRRQDPEESERWVVALVSVVYTRAARVVAWMLGQERCWLDQSILSHSYA